MAAKSVSPASPLGEKHIFENQTVKLGKDDIDDEPDLFKFFNCDS